MIFAILKSILNSLALVIIKQSSYVLLVFLLRTIQSNNIIIRFLLYYEFVLLFSFKFDLKDQIFDYSDQMIDFLTLLIKIIVTLFTVYSTGKFDALWFWAHFEPYPMFGLSVWTVCLNSQTRGS